jgi:hypothetical protein
MKKILDEIVGLSTCLAIVMPVIWWALKVFFGD